MNEIKIYEVISERRSWNEEESEWQYPWWSENPDRHEYYIQCTEDKVKSICEILNKICGYKEDRTYLSYVYEEFVPKTVEEVENDIIKEAKYEINELAKEVLNDKESIEFQKKSIDTLKDIKELVKDLPKDKAPCDMIPELIKLIQGTDLPVEIIEYYNPHLFKVYDTNGNVEERTGENFLNGGGLYTKNKIGCKYSQKWDIDKDITIKVEYIDSLEKEIKNNEKKIESINNILEKGEQP